MRNPPHPGGILKRQYIEPMGLNVTETAKALKVSRKQLSQLLNERAGISPEMALRLSDAFDTTPELWLNLQKAKDLRDARKRYKAKIAMFPRPRFEEEEHIATGQKQG